MLNRLCFRICHVFLIGVEKIAGSKWQFSMWRRCLGGGPYECRMLEPCKGDLQRKVETEVENLLYNEEAWSTLHGDAYTFGMMAIAFAQISAAWCSLDHLAFRLFLGFPWQMWTLVLERTRANALRILGYPLCRLDEWSRRFLLRWNTVELLLSDDCIAILMALGHLLRWEICGLECRNAQIRRFARSGDTWIAEFMQVAARWYLQRLRTTAFSVPESAGQNASCQKVKKKVVRKRKRGRGKGEWRTGGGGRQRACISKFLKGTTYTSPEERRANFARATCLAREEREAGGAAHETSIRLGTAGTASHAQGVRRPFGPHHRDSRLVGMRRKREAAALGQLAPPLETAIVAQPDRDTDREKEDRAQEQEVRDWSAAAVAPGVPDQERPHGHPVPCGRGPVQLEVFIDEPPADVIMKRSGALIRGRQKDFMCTLDDFWEEYHRMKLHKNAKAMPEQPEVCRPLASHLHDGACYRAEACVCGEAPVSSDGRMREALCKALRPLFRKGGVGAAMYAQNRIVLRISSVGDGADGDLTLWYHIGFGNLRDVEFRILPLRLASESDRPWVAALQFEGGVLLEPMGRPANMQVLGTCSLTREWRLSLYTLATTSDAPVPWFCPLAPAWEHDPVVSVVLWTVGPAAPGLRRLRAIGPPVERPALEDDSGSEGDGGPGRPRGQEDPVLLGWQLDPSSSESSESSESDSSLPSTYASRPGDGPDSSDDGSGSGSGSGGDSGGSVVDPAPVVPVVPVPEDPPVPRVAAGMRTVMLRGREFSELMTKGVPVGHSILCELCGQSKNLSWRPGGVLTQDEALDRLESWASACPGTKEDHKRLGGVLLRDFAS